MIYAVIRDITDRRKDEKELALYWGHSKDLVLQILIRVFFLSSVTVLFLQFENNGEKSLAAYRLSVASGRAEAGALDGGKRLLVEPRPG